MLTAANVTLMSREDNVTFICKVRGNPRPSVYLQMVDDLFEWRNVDVKPLVTPNITTQIWKFFLSNEHNNITGRYRCISNNTVGGIALSNIVVVAEFKGNCLKFTLFATFVSNTVRDVYSRAYL